MIIAAWLSVGLMLADEVSIGRPWTPVDDPASASRKRIDDAADEASLVVALALALDSGRYTDVVRGTPDDLTKAGAALLSVLGLERGSDGCVPIEAARFEAAAPQATTRLPPLSEAERKRLLKGRFQDMKLANSAAYFDMWSDLSGADLAPYTSLLSEYYRRNRNRFRADLSGKIDVVLYGNRADYLRSYARSFKESGENVLGYYLPALNRLVFYDDPAEREQISLTARHECTHLLVDLSFDNDAIPPWLNEGLACYLAAGGEDAAGQYTANLIQVVQRLLKANKAHGLRDLMLVDAKKLEYAHYAWAWSLVHFLNEGKREKSFRDFLAALRERLTPELKPADVSSIVLDEFTSAFGGNMSGLEAEWWQYMEHDFRLTRPDQLLDYARGSLVVAAHAKNDAEARLSLDEAGECFLALLASGDDEQKAEARLGRLETIVARAHVDEIDLDGALHLLRNVRDELPGLPPIADEGRKGRLVREALDTVRNATAIRRREQGSFDLRAALVEASGRVTGASKARTQALVALHDDVLGACFTILARRLTENPLDRTAAQEWLYLAIEHAPSRIREVFDYLQVLVDREPDDRNLAALGAAYFALGKERYGKALVARAERWSFQPSVLELSKRYVGLK